MKPAAPIVRCCPNITRGVDDTVTDVVIIGAGVSGCSIARELSRRKADILVVEREEDDDVQNVWHNWEE